MMTWIICGAGRGVGKTHFARKLCKVLPGTVYAKCGCGKAASTKQPNFFRTQEDLNAFLQACRGSYEHAVVESNAMARMGKGDVIIFLGRREGMTDVRPDADQLRRRAHLAICPGVSVRDWKKVLRRKLPDKQLCEAICDLLVEQKQRLARRRPEVRSKVWFTVGDMHVFGTGLAGLLHGVEKWGTLSRAAREVRMSYRYAWNLLRKVEKHLGEKLVLPRVGGVGGGHSTLSDEGRRLTSAFDRLNRDVAAFADKRFAQLCEKNEGTQRDDSH